MTSITLQHKVPPRTPWEQVYLAETDTQVTLTPPPGHKWTRAMVSADYTNNKLPDWNQEYAVVTGTPWSHNSEWTVANIGSTLINNGTAKLHRATDWYTSDTKFNPGSAFNWTLDKTNHKYSYEFYLENTQTKNNATTIDACETIDGWSASSGTNHVFATDTDKVAGTYSLKVTGNADAIGFTFNKSFANVLQGKEFLEFWIKSDVACKLRLLVKKSDSAWIKEWADNRSIFSISAGVWMRFVIPVKAPQGTTGHLPNSVTGTYSEADNIILVIGISGVSEGRAVTVRVDDICADVGGGGSPATGFVKLEQYVPDVILAAATAINVYAWDGSAWQKFLNWHPTSATGNTLNAAKLFFMDGGKASDYYGSGLGAAGFAQANRAAAGARNVGDSGAGTITYSSNYGLQKRVGFAIKMPPSDGKQSSTAGISQCKLKLEVYYAPEYPAAPTLIDVSDGASSVTNPGYTLHPNGVYGVLSGQDMHAGNFYNSWTWDFGKSRTGTFTVKWYHSTTRSASLAVNMKYTIRGSDDGSTWNTLVTDAVTTSFMGPGGTYTSPIRTDSFYGTYRYIRLQAYSGDPEEGWATWDMYVDAVYLNNVVSGLATYEFSNDTNQYTGLQNINNSWYLFANPTTKDIDYYIFSKKPVGMTVRVDENELIDKAVFTITKGTRILWGQLTHNDLTASGDWFPSTTLYPSDTLYPRTGDIPAFVSDHIEQIISKAYYSGG